VAFTSTSSGARELGHFVEAFQMVPVNPFHYPGIAFYSQIKATSATTILSDAFLGRARSIAAEHAQLSKQLAESYDVKLAKRVGELDTTTTVLKEWEEAHSVRDLPFLTGH
jgi:hypothetical protein